MKLFVPWGTTTIGSKNVTKLRFASSFDKTIFDIFAASV